MSTVTGTTDASLRSTWSLAHTFERIYHKAVRTEEGLLVLAGGQLQHSASPTATPSAVVFDAYAESTLGDGARQVSYRWTLLGETLTVASQNFGMALSGDDIYLLGGHSGVQKQASNAFDVLTYRKTPALNSLTSFTAPFRVGAPGMCANGDAIQVSGGFINWNVAVKDTWTYVPSAGTWTSRSAMHDARLDHQLVPVGTLVMAIGGRAPFAPLVENSVASAHYWNFDADGNDQIGTLNLTLGAADITKIGKGGNCLRVGAVSVVASAGAEQTALNAACLDSVTVEGWATKGTGTVVSVGGSGTGGAANDILLNFGVDPTSHKFFVSWQHGANVAVNLQSTDLYTDHFTVADSNAQPVFYHFAVVRQKVSTGVCSVSLYINGALLQSWTGQALPTGSDGSAALLYVGHDSSGTVANYTGAVDEIRVSPAALGINDVLRHFDHAKGDIYFDRIVVADRPLIGRCLETCELFDTVGNTWSRTGGMAYARFGFGACSLPDGRILVVGGLGYPASEVVDPQPLAAAEIYDPHTGLWSVLPPCGVARPFPVIALVPSMNAVLVASGGSYETLELDTMTWKSGLVPLPVGDYRAAGGLVSTDLVLVAGGGTAAATGLTEKSNAIFVPGGEKTAQGGLNGEFVVAEVVSDTEFTYLTPGFTDYTLDEGAATITPVGALASSIPGPFVFDPKDGVAVTGTEATVDLRLEENRQYSVLTLRITAMTDEQPARRFPDGAGYLVFNFGNPDQQVAPVRYYGRLSDNELKLDYDFRFPHSVEAGSTVSLLSQRAPFSPSTTKLVGSLYATASSAGRVAANAAIDETAAAGLVVNKTILYPGDRGLGGEGFPDRLSQKLSDRVAVWAGNDITAELEEARKGDI